MTLLTPQGRSGPGHPSNGQPDTAEQRTRKLLVRLRDHACNGREKLPPAEALPTETAPTAPPPAPPAPTVEPLAVDAKVLATMLGLSVRTIRAMDAAGKLPRPVRLGHAVRWPLRIIEDWLDAGAPDRRTWQAMQEDKR